MFTITSCKKNETTYINEVRPKVGYLPPGFSLNDLDGNTIKLSDYKGKVVLVEFWASWCSYCIEEIPTLKSIYAEYQEQNFEMIGISLDTNPEAWRDKVQEENLEYIQVNDPAGFSSDVAKQYEIESIPRMFLINEEGYIILITTEASDVEIRLSQLFN